MKFFTAFQKIHQQYQKNVLHSMFSLKNFPETNNPFIKHLTRAFEATNPQTTTKRNFLFFSPNRTHPEKCQSRRSIFTTSKKWLPKIRVIKPKTFLAQQRRGTSFLFRCHKTARNDLWRAMNAWQERRSSIDLFGEGFGCKSLFKLDFER
jgi:hypothetical protein